MRLVFLILVIISSTIISSCAQSRTNRSPLIFQAKSKQFTKATGWQKNEITGQWVENKNAIDDRRVGMFGRSFLKQNFQFIQFATIHTGQSLYYVLLVERKAGYYRYPNIREEWIPYKETLFMVISPEEYNAFKEYLQSKSGEDYIVKSVKSGSIDNIFTIRGGQDAYNDSGLLIHISKKMEEEYIGGDCLIVNAQSLDGKDIIRFRIPEECSRTSKYFPEQYFEAPLFKFTDILIP